MTSNPPVAKINEITSSVSATNSKPKNHHKRKKRGVTETPIEPPDRIWNQIIRIKQENVRAYVCCLYLTGGRCREILGIRRKIPGTPRLEKDKDILKRLGRYEVEPLRKSQIEETDNWITLYGVPTLKRFGRPQRSIPIIRNQMEAPFIAEFLNYANKKKDNEYIWTFSHQYVEKILRETTGYHLHWLRSVRATYLSTRYGLDTTNIQKFFNWASADYAALYAQLNVEDIKKKMEEKR